MRRDKHSWWSGRGVAATASIPTLRDDHTAVAVAMVGHRLEPSCLASLQGALNQPLIHLADQVGRDHERLERAVAQEDLATDDPRLVAELAQQSYELVSCDPALATSRILCPELLARLPALGMSELKGALGG